MVALNKDIYLTYVEFGLHEEDSICYCLLLVVLRSSIAPIHGIKDSRGTVADSEPHGRSGPTLTGYDQDLRRIASDIYLGSRHRSGDTRHFIEQKRYWKKE